MTGSVPLRLALAAACLLGLPGAAPLGRLAIAVEGLRSDKGLVQLCVTADPHHFPACEGDPAAFRLTMPAGKAATLHIDALPSGDYATALFHDENGNGKLDTRMGIPVEGFGFSNNPRILFGPPNFAAARVAVAGPETDETVKLRYLF